MTWIIINIIVWLGINALIGYAIGKSKNNVGGSIMLSILHKRKFWERRARPGPERVAATTIQSA